MIEKLLDVARVDSGQIVLKTAPYRLHDLLEKYVCENQDYLENKGFKVKFTSRDKSSMCVLDEDSLETILNNLTDNAIKYSGDQKVIHYTLYSDRSDLFISVRDEGIGIPKKAIKNIFNKFYRVEDSLKAKTKGHGLGLSIVKNLVDLNGGEINVKSNVGKGTTFIISFPKLTTENFSTEKIEIGHKGDTLKNPTEYAG